MTRNTTKENTMIKKTYGQVKLEKEVPKILDELLAVKIALAWAEKKNTQEYEKSVNDIMEFHAIKEKRIKHYLS